jgi:hypothetical protein
MNVKIVELNDGIIKYLGYGVDKFPCAHIEKLIDEFGHEKGAYIECQVIALLCEANNVVIDWSKNSLSSAGREVANYLHEKHPELSEMSLHAIAWKFTFDWR